MSINTEKIRQNADLLVPISSCPFGEPIDECPFISYYALNDKQKQMEQVELIPQDQLEDLRTFHRACMSRYRNGEWRLKRNIRKGKL